jgi:hypothetical protein
MDEKVEVTYHVDLQFEGHEEHSPCTVYLRSTVLTPYGPLDLGEGEVLPLHDAIEGGERDKILTLHDDVDGLIMMEYSKGGVGGEGHLSYRME